MSVSISFRGWLFVCVHSRDSCVGGGGGKEVGEEHYSSWLKLRLELGRRTLFSRESEVTALRECMSVGRLLIRASL